MTAAEPPHAVLDPVELRSASGQWPAGTVGTVVEADNDRALVEISDDRGHGLDFIALPHEVIKASVKPGLAHAATSVEADGADSPVLDRGRA